jgi:hypothetical protein
VSFVTPETTIWYYESVLNKMGKNQSEWVRLFMAPGMGHCGGGPGVNTFDSIGTLEKRVEKGAAPDTMLGTGAQGLTRPLCPFLSTRSTKEAGISRTPPPGHTPRRDQPVERRCHVAAARTDVMPCATSGAHS